MIIFTSAPEEIKPTVKKAEEFLGQYFERYRNIEVYSFLSAEEYPRQHYRDGLWGISKDWFRSFILGNLWESRGKEAVMFHVPEFEREGAAGWFTTINGMPVMQAYTRHDEPTVRNNEFDTRLIETIVHEVGHHESRRQGVRDRTHYWMDKSYASLFEEIVSQSPSRMQRWINRFINYINSGDEKLEEPWVVHHSASEHDTVQGIVNYHTPDYGRTFYNVIIDKEGKVHRMHNELNARGYGRTYDVCVLGDYRTAYRKEQVEALEDFLAGKDWITHGEAADIKMAGTNPTECPGKLAEHINFII